ncbi:hypothetical protein ACFV3R_08755 [Streptomyces sp. NPDC059740]|uniref:hypothetical protein n=1 Tax=Streptomyces sp. NPDC059740 TaxID=3346926 RepID=UPI0036650BB1
MTTTTGTPPVGARFEAARQVADAVLLEGYVLYPYRASASKNRLRWQFGVLVPPGWATGGEHSHQRTELLLEPRGDAQVEAELRFLRARRRGVQRLCPGGGFEDCERIELPDRVVTAWDEGVVETLTFTVPSAHLTQGPVDFPFHCEAREETEEVADAAGTVLGRLVRRSSPVTGRLRLEAAELPGPYRTLRLCALVENLSDWTPRTAGEDRAAALPHSLIATHLLLGVDRGAFLSVTDPPQWASGAVAECRNENTWPVLAGADGGGDVVLSSPIILGDHPAVAPESAGEFHDATEIDEMLALRTLTLTDEEKREVRGTDERAAAVVDLADTLPPEVMERLHGAVRSLREVTREAPGESGEGSWEDALRGVVRPDAPWWDPAADRSVDPTRDRVAVEGGQVGAGDRVRLRPGARRTDAQDLFLHGRTATVEAVLHDVDGGVHVAVTVDGDPGADLRRLQGRFLYFQPDEVSREVER